MERLPLSDEREVAEWDEMVSGVCPYDAYAHVHIAHLGKVLGFFCYSVADLSAGIPMLDGGRLY
jgi:hypothetical protein